MSELAELIKRVGEPYDPERHMADFGLDLEDADRVADFYNNGGLELHVTGFNYALQYACVMDDKVFIGTWSWMDGEDFDEDATFEVYDEDDFSAGELRVIINKIKEIYEN